MISLITSRGTAPADQLLADYRRKRDFSKTPEPAPKRGKPHQRPIFVGQEHHARRLHYDLRLEADGVLKSWAVTKIPSMNFANPLSFLFQRFPHRYRLLFCRVPAIQSPAARTAHIHSLPTDFFVATQRTRTPPSSLRPRFTESVRAPRRKGKG